MRYIKRLDRKDISLAQCHVSLGSCHMKLNAACRNVAFKPFRVYGNAPLVPEDQAEGYRELIRNLSDDLKIITGFAGVSLQPNSGAAGEYTGLRVIRGLSGKYRSRTPEQDIDTRIGSWNESCIGYPGGIYNNHLRVRRARKCEDG